eukprot:scaffold324678_cov130-Tisochrysis_lutea.AAC.1
MIHVILQDLWMRMTRTCSLTTLTPLPKNWAGAQVRRGISRRRIAIGVWWPVRWKQGMVIVFGQSIEAVPKHVSFWDACMK